MTHRASVIYLFGYSIPSWMFACLAGILIAFFIREVMILLKIQFHIPFPTVFYSAIALIGAIMSNYLWIGGY